MQDLPQKGSPLSCGGEVVRAMAGAGEGCRRSCWRGSNCTAVSDAGSKQSLRGTSRRCAWAGGER
jgi:hypothetical protein